MGKRRSRTLLNVLLLATIAFASSRCGRTAPTAAESFTPIPSPSVTLTSEQPDTAPTVTPTAGATPSRTPKATHTPTVTATSTPEPTAAATDTQTPSPSVTATSTPVPQPTATPPLSGEPTVHYFRSNVDAADPGDTIVLEWESSGATRGVLSPISASGQMPPSGLEVAASGTHTYEVPSDARNVSRFYLAVYNEKGESADAGLSVPLHCPAVWFFQPEPEGCGADPISSDAAEQHFQHGTMVWVAAKDAVFVLYDDERASPKWEMFTDEWDEGEADHDPAIVPPADHYQPVRGFGMIWREKDWLRDRLGWAVDHERAFDTIMQTTTLYKYNSIYLKALDGDVWHLGPERSSWTKLPVTAP